MALRKFGYWIQKTCQDSTTRKGVKPSFPDNQDQAPPNAIEWHHWMPNVASM